MKKYTFERLETWQFSRRLVLNIYICTKSFPEEEKFGLISQLRRAMISVSCNLAEGTTRTTFKEKIRFLEISYSSLMEVLNCLILAHDLQYLDQSTFITLREQIDQVYNKMKRLKSAYSNKIKRPNQ